MTFFDSRTFCFLKSNAIIAQPKLEVPHIPRSLPSHCCLSLQASLPLSINSIVSLAPYTLVSQKQPRGANSRLSNDFRPLQGQITPPPYYSAQPRLQGQVVCLGAQPAAGQKGLAHTRPRGPPVLQIPAGLEVVNGQCPRSSSDMSR
jgi:hypothetical protein